MTQFTRARRRALIGSGLAVATATALVLTGCAPSGGDTGGDADSIEEALQQETTLTVWAWDPGFEPIAEAFEKEYPAITVDVVNAGTGTDQYVKLQNAIAAGSGAPDVAQMEYQAIPQFALTNGLYDLSEVGYSDLEDLYSAGAWGNVAVNGGIYGLPLGTGPMALFYNKAVFDKFGITEPPATWAEYAEDAKTIHDADPNSYITNDAGDAGFLTSLIWQAGGRPFETKDGTDVTIDLQDAGSVQVADAWTPLVENDLVTQTPSWSDEWYQGLNNGTIASLVIGGWMAGNLESGVPDGAGDWRVAPMPAWSAGDSATAENGGGGASVLSQSKNKLVAAAFVKFLTTDKGQEIELDTVGGVPSTVANLEDPEWVNKEWDYFGGQKVNEVLAESAKNVATGWQYLPFQVYANSIFGDTVGQSYANRTDLNTGLVDWQDALVDYGNQQGFNVNK